MGKYKKYRKVYKRRHNAKQNKIKHTAASDVGRNSYKNRRFKQKRESSDSDSLLNEENVIKRLKPCFVYITKWNSDNSVEKSNSCEEKSQSSQDHSYECSSISYSSVGNSSNLEATNSTSKKLRKLTHTWENDSSASYRREKSPSIASDISSLCSLSEICSPRKKPPSIASDASSVCSLNEIRMPRKKPPSIASEASSVCSLNEIRTPRKKSPSIASDASSVSKIRPRRKKSSFIASDTSSVCSLNEIRTPTKKSPSITSDASSVSKIRLRRKKSSFIASDTSSVCSLNEIRTPTKKSSCIASDASSVSKIRPRRKKSSFIASDTSSVCSLNEIRTPTKKSPSIASDASSVSKIRLRRKKSSFIASDTSSVCSLNEIRTPRKKSPSIASDASSVCSVREIRSLKRKSPSIVSDISSLHSASEIRTLRKKSPERMSKIKETKYRGKGRTVHCESRNTQSVLLETDPTCSNEILVENCTNNNNRGTSHIEQRIENFDSARRKCFAESFNSFPKNRVNLNFLSKESKVKLKKLEDWSSNSYNTKPCFVVLDKMNDIDWKSKSQEGKGVNYNKDTLLSNCRDHETLMVNVNNFEAPNSYNVKPCFVALDKQNKINDIDLKNKSQRMKGENCNNDTSLSNCGGALKRSMVNVNDFETANNYNIKPCFVALEKMNGIHLKSESQRVKEAKYNKDTLVSNCRVILKSSMGNVNNFETAKRQNCPKTSKISDEESSSDMECMSKNKSNMILPLEVTVREKKSDKIVSDEEFLSDREYMSENKSDMILPIEVTLSDIKYMSEHKSGKIVSDGESLSDTECMSESKSDMILPFEVAVREKKSDKIVSDEEFLSDRECMSENKSDMILPIEVTLSDIKYMSENKSGKIVSDGESLSDTECMSENKSDMILPVEVSLSDIKCISENNSGKIVSPEKSLSDTECMSENRSDKVLSDRESLSDTECWSEVESDTVNCFSPDWQSPGIEALSNCEKLSNIREWSICEGPFAEVKSENQECKKELSKGEHLSGIRENKSDRLNFLSLDRQSLDGESLNEIENIYENKGDIQDYNLNEKISFPRKSLNDTESLEGKNSDAFDYGSCDNLLKCSKSDEELESKNVNESSENEQTNIDKEELLTDFGRCDEFMHLSGIENQTLPSKEKIKKSQYSDSSTYNSGESKLNSKDSVSNCINKCERFNDLHIFKTKTGKCYIVELFCYENIEKLVVTVELKKSSSYAPSQDNADDGNRKFRTISEKFSSLGVSYGQCLKHHHDIQSTSRCENFENSPLSKTVPERNLAVNCSCDKQDSNKNFSMNHEASTSFRKSIDVDDTIESISSPDTIENSSDYDLFCANCLSKFSNVNENYNHTCEGKTKKGFLCRYCEKISPCDKSFKEHMKMHQSI